MDVLIQMRKKYGRMLDASLEPAKRRDQLSPADRLFGWAPQAQGNYGGYKGRIRVICEEVVSEDSKDPENNKKRKIIQRFEAAEMPLTILSTPKPSYARFYVAKNEQGDPQKDGLSKKQVGYDSNKSLRGRKQYWHHKGLEIDLSKPESEQAKEYWHPSVEDRTQLKCNNRYQEYRRPDQRHEESQNGWQQKDKQNRSIKGWIAPGTVFKAKLYVQNLQPEEVGALLWLLLLSEFYGENHYFKIGYGKPLGFGSVRMEIDEDECPNRCLPLGTGEDWKNYYAAFDADVSSLGKLNDHERNQCIDEFKDSMARAYNAQCFDDLRFISGFLQVLRGPKTDLPIHYPRQEEKPSSESKSLDWFKANDSKEGLKLTLPAVTEENALLHDPKKP